MKAGASSIISAKKANFVGLGRLGLCTALKIEKTGWDILGVDVFPNYVKSINDKNLKSCEPGVEEVCKQVLRFHCNFPIGELSRLYT